MTGRRLTWALLAFSLLASPALGNEFVNGSASDWFRYAGGGQPTESRALNTEGNWIMWGNFAGLGDTWVYTEQGTNWWAVWNGQTYQILPTFDGPVGLARTVTLANWGQTTFTVGEVNGTLDTAAGRFTGVTRLDVRIAGLADAGVTSMWVARGVGVVKWEESSFAGALTRELSQAYVGGRLIPATTPTTPAATTPGRLVAPTEHDRMESILWGCSDTYLVLDTYIDAFSGLNGSGAMVECAVDSQQVAAQLRYELTSAGVPLSEVEIFVVALDTLWMRDYGPIVLKDTNTGRRVVADLEYYPGRYRDDRFPRAYAQLKGWDVVDVDISFEGGNFATDGKGLGMASRGVLWFNQDKSQNRIEREFQLLGCDRMEYFEPLVDEGTTHIDMFARVMSDTDALVSRYPSNHRQARVVNDAARKLEALGYRVSRVDSDTSHDEYATYANSVLANGVALVPQYRSSTRNRAALDAYRAQGYRAVGIDSSLIIQYGGATHCASMQIPAGQ